MTGVALGGTAGIGAGYALSHLAGGEVESPGRITSDEARNIPVKAGQGLFVGGIAGLLGAGITKSAVGGATLGAFYLTAWTGSAIASMHRQ